jgi:hypothetical protein
MIAGQMAVLFTLSKGLLFRHNTNIGKTSVKV